MEKENALDNGDPPQDGHRSHPKTRRSQGSPTIDGSAATKFANATGLTVVSVDAMGKMRFVNPEAADLFGYELQEMVGQPVETIIPERLRQAHASGFARAVAAEKLNLRGKRLKSKGVGKTAPNSR